MGVRRGSHQPHAVYPSRNLPIRPSCARSGSCTDPSAQRPRGTTEAFMIRRNLALIAALVLVISGQPSAEEAEFARVARNGDTATLRVFGARPVDLAARKLVDEFALAVNVEDPF